MTWRTPLRSLTLRLTLVYMALFCGSVGLMLAVSYLGGVWRPLREVEATVRAQSDALVAVYDTQGRNALIRALELFKTKVEAGPVRKHGNIPL